MKIVDSSAKKLSQSKFQNVQNGKNSFLWIPSSPSHKTPFSTEIYNLEKVSTWFPVKIRLLNVSKRLIFIHETSGKKYLSFYQQQWSQFVFDSFAIFSFFNANFVFQGWRILFVSQQIQ